jgi:hypothetical protein
VRVRFTPEALRSIREKRVWWEANRDKAPRLFVEELASVIGKLRNDADTERQGRPRSVSKHRFVSVRSIRVRSVAGTTRGGSVAAKEERLSTLLQERESLGAIEGTRTSTVLPTGT